MPLLSGFTFLCPPTTNRRAGPDNHYVLQLYENSHSSRLSHWGRDTPCGGRAGGRWRGWWWAGDQGQGADQASQGRAIVVTKMRIACGACHGHTQTLPHSQHYWIFLHPAHTTYTKSILNIKFKKGSAQFESVRLIPFTAMTAVRFSTAMTSELCNIIWSLYKHSWWLGWQSHLWLVSWDVAVWQSVDCLYNILFQVGDNGGLLQLMVWRSEW